MLGLMIGTRVIYRSASNKLNGRSGVIAGPEHPALGYPVDFEGLPKGIYCSTASLKPKGDKIATSNSDKEHHGS